MYSMNSTQKVPQNMYTANYDRFLAQRTCIESCHFQFQQILTDWKLNTDKHPALWNKQGVQNGNSVLVLKCQLKTQSTKLDHRHSHHTGFPLKCRDENSATFFPNPRHQKFRTYFSTSKQWFSHRKHKTKLNGNVKQPSQTLIIDTKCSSITSLSLSSKTT